MCLLTSMKRPVEADRDLHCFKFLHFNSYENIYLTPWRREMVTFKNGYAVQSVNTFRTHLCFPRDPDWWIEVYEGVHSFYKTYKRRNRWPDCISFHAVIPKETLVYFSDNINDPNPIDIPVASLKLIIFKTYFHYLMYKVGLLKIKE